MPALKAIVAVAGLMGANAQMEDVRAEMASAFDELKTARVAEDKMVAKLKAEAAQKIKEGKKDEGEKLQAKADEISHIEQAIDEHIGNVNTASIKMDVLGKMAKNSQQIQPAGFLQIRSSAEPEAEAAAAEEMTKDLEVNFNKIAPFGKEDTAHELQSHASKTQDTLVDAVENAEVAEIKRAVFRALTRLRAATIKEFDTIARLETQAIDAYNDAHHYRAENPLTHLHDDEAPVPTDKLKSFH